MSAARSSLFPAVAVRLAALWVLVGALFKLFLGTPADLPAVVRDVPLALGTTYRLAIAIELVLVALALLKPRVGWAPLALLYTVFGYVLQRALAAGETSCGCLGSKVEIAPATMLWIDGVLLALVLLSRPWRSAERGLAWRWLAPAALVLFALPWVFDREVQAPRPVENATAGTATAPPVRAPQSGFAVLDPEEWVGKTIAETPLAALIEEDLATLPTDGMWILWRWTCDHCAAHLEELARHPPAEEFITLVRLHEQHDSDENQLVWIKPEGAYVVEANLPASVEYVIETPAELVLQNGVIVSGREGVETEGHEHPELFPTNGGSAPGGAEAPASSGGSTDSPPSGSGG